MRREIGITLVLGVLATAALASSGLASAQPRLTRCVATTLTQSGAGMGVFVGSCNGSATSLSILPGSVAGRVGGLSTKLKGGTGSGYTGRIGASKASFTLSGSSVTGRYGAEALKFSILGTSISGRVGSLRVTCSISPVNPLGERVACAGTRGGAQVLVPLLAVLYVAS